MLSATIPAEKIFSTTKVSHQILLNKSISLNFGSELLQTKSFYFLNSVGDIAFNNRYLQKILEGEQMGGKPN